MEKSPENEVSVKASFIAALNDIGVDVPQTASLMQIRQLYQITLAERIHGSSNNGTSDNQINFDNPGNEPANLANSDEPHDLPANPVNLVEPVIHPANPENDLQRYSAEPIMNEMPLIPIDSSRVSSVNVQHNLNTNTDNIFDAQNIDAEIAHLEKLRRLQQLRAEISAYNVMPSE